MDDTKNARDIMAEEADAAIADDYEVAETAELTQEEKQARYDEAVAQMHQRQEDERELQRREERRQYRQFVAGQLYPEMIRDAPPNLCMRSVADNTVRLADVLIAALDRAETLDGASDTEQ